jgi:hypothetical protein
MIRRVGIAQHLSWYEFGSSIVVLDELADQRVVLNQTAAFLWLELESFPAEDALVRALEREYEVSLEVARRDVSHWLESMIEQGLVALQ